MLDRLILGLGNPGPKYRETRHNCGFRVVEELARRRHLSLNRLECKSLLVEGRELVLAAPQTFMNRSGYAARCLSERREIQPADMLIVYDDVWLDLGQLRLRTKGGPGGHRGMESVIRNLGTESVPRLRLGVGNEDRPPQGEELVDFVLSPFAPTEEIMVEKMIERAADACEMWLQEGAEPTMNRFNE
ncbi:MAG: aminoacyl-tRNA hydrolase [Thermoanaerobaculia bacterium]